MPSRAYSPIFNWMKSSLAYLLTWEMGSFYLALVRNTNGRFWNLKLQLFASSLCILIKMWTHFGNHQSIDGHDYAFPMGKLWDLHGKRNWNLWTKSEWLAMWWCIQVLIHPIYNLIGASYIFSSIGMVSPRMCTLEKSNISSRPRFQNMESWLLLLHQYMVLLINAFF